MTDPALHGFTIGITADRRWQEQAALFERRAATVLHGPTIRTMALGSDEPLENATRDLIGRPPAALVANTGLGMRAWFSAAETWGLGERLRVALAGSRIYARGPKASAAVHGAGLAVVARAATERLREAVDLALADARPGDRVAVQVDGGGDGAELARLRARGVEAVAVPVYEWRFPDDVGPALRLAEAVIAGRVHAVTFTAGPAVRNWLAIAAEHERAEQLRAALAGGDVVVGCVGPVCADAARAEGIAGDHVVVPAAFRLAPMVRAVADRLAPRPVPAE